MDTKAIRRQKAALRRELSSWQKGAITLLLAAVLGDLLLFGVCRYYRDGRDTAKAGEEAARLQQLADQKEAIAAHALVLEWQDQAEEARLMLEDAVEEAENAKIEAALLKRSVQLQNVTVTHYTKDTCGKAPGDPSYGITASGKYVTPYVTVAVDPRVIPLGSTVMVDYGDGELHYYRAEDTGGAVRGLHLDLCVQNVDEAIALGRRTATVWWCEEGSSAAMGTSP